MKRKKKRRKEQTTNKGRCGYGNGLCRDGANMVDSYTLKVKIKIKIINLKNKTNKQEENRSCGLPETETDRQTDTERENGVKAEAAGCTGNSRPCCPMSRQGALSG